ADRSGQIIESSSFRGEDLGPLASPRPRSGHDEMEMEAGLLGRDRWREDRAARGRDDPGNSEPPSPLNGVAMNRVDRNSARYDSGSLYRNNPGDVKRSYRSGCTTRL
ncbi:MAG: hypothetical protein ACREOH_06010, partial [Candidatus Entotheonellia bacterium]